MSKSKKQTNIEGKDIIEQNNDEKTSKIPLWREKESQGRRKPVGKYGIDMGERGVYDKRNKLNDLTGKEWTYFLRSVIVEAYPPTIRNGVGFDLRKIHPSPKPPQLMKEFILFFTKQGQWILDPFVGVGGSLLGASLCDGPRHGVGIDLNPDYLAAYKQVCKLENLPEEVVICGDSKEILKNGHPELEREFDLIITDPPYANMMTRPKTGQKKRFYGQSDPTPYTLDPRDIGNLEYDEFLVEFKEIMQLAVDRLASKKHVVVFCKDLQPKPGKPNILHADIINTLVTIPGLEYRGLKVWYDQANNLFPFGYPYAFVVNQLHTYIMVFQKQ